MRSSLRWIPAFVLLLGFAGCGDTTEKTYGCPNLPSWEDFRCPCDPPANGSGPCDQRGGLTCFYGASQETRCDCHSVCGAAPTWSCATVVDGGARDGGGTTTCGDGGSDDGGMSMGDGSTSDGSTGDASVSDAPMSGG